MSCAIFGLGRCALYYQIIRCDFLKYFNCIKKFRDQWYHRYVCWLYYQLQRNLKIKRKERIPLRNSQKLLFHCKLGEF